MNNMQVSSCVIVDAYDRLLLVHNGEGEYTQWELPGASVDIDGEETLEEAAVRGAREILGAQVKLVKALGFSAFETDEGEFVYNWFQAKIVGGDAELISSNSFDDFDYFELEDLMSLGLSANVELLLEKISFGDIAIDL